MKVRVLSVIVAECYVVFLLVNAEREERAGGFFAKILVWAFY
jgi:hypothetical protein